MQRPLRGASLLASVLSGHLYAGFEPVIKVNQKLIACPLRDGTCILPGYGTLEAEPHSLGLSFKAERPLTVQGLAWRSVLAHAEEPLGWLSNGYQSWSLSGYIKLPRPLRPWSFKEDIDIRSEENRSGRGPSAEYGGVYSEKEFVFFGATTQSTWRPWVYAFERTDRQVEIWLASGFSGESIELASGEYVRGESWFQAAGALNAWPQELKKYNAELGLKTYEPRVGWNSWYQFWNQVKPADILQNAPLVAKVFAERPETRQQKPLLVLDDGWAQGWGDWEPKAEYAALMPRLAGELKSQGLRAGLWLAPFLVRQASPLIKAHPAWFLATKPFVHPSGTYQILDVTHPEVQTHLSALVAKVRDWGFEHLKIDFLFTGSFEAPRYQSMTGTEAYKTGLRLIRAAWGREHTLLACGAPHLASRPYVDSWRSGPDIAFEAPTGELAWGDVGIQAHNLAARWFLCGGLACDTDPFLLRSRLNPLKRQSAAWVPALAGQGLTISDDLRKITQAAEGLDWGEAYWKQALSGEPAIPHLIAPQRLARELRPLKWWERWTSKSPALPPLRWTIQGGEQVLLKF